MMEFWHGTGVLVTGSSNQQRDRDGGADGSLRPRGGRNERQPVHDGRAQSR
jgi:hypothetical protein